VSNIFAILGVLVTIASINCEHSLAAVVYRRLLYRNNCNSSAAPSNNTKSTNICQTILLPGVTMACKLLVSMSRGLQHRSALSLPPCFVHVHDSLSQPIPESVKSAAASLSAQPLDLR
jgi:hypothetical protein